MSKTLVKNARIVDQGNILESDLLIVGDIIERRDANISEAGSKVIDLQGDFLLPGVIDDQVHFREPGLTHKGDIFTESRAAVAGGITSFMEQPNTNPQTTTIEKLESKFDSAKDRSHANYSFLFGGTNDNLEEIKRLDKKACSGVKLFLGSSTGNMLVDDEVVIEKIFRSTEMVISTHCEDEGSIRRNFEHYKGIYGDDIPIPLHPKIRSAEACYLSSSKAVELAKRTGARLHVFHVSTEKETHLFDNSIPLSEKKITAEVCIHHLWFNDSFYNGKGAFIKWNPAVKTKEDQEGLWKALLDDRFDIVATDHAPHTLGEKSNVYTQCPSGGPLVQHALQAMVQKVQDGKISMGKVVEKMCHNPAILFDVEKRGFIQEGNYADLVQVSINDDYKVTKKNILYKCGWSPFEGFTFNNTVKRTWVNGGLVFENGKVIAGPNGKRLTFDR